MFERGIQWRELVSALHRRRSVLGKVLGVGVALTVVGVFLLGPRWPATATVLVTVERTRPPVAPGLDIQMTIPETVTDADMSSEIALLRSEELVRTVLASQPEPARQVTFTETLTRAVRSPLALVERAYRAIHDLPPPAPLAVRAGRVAKHLDVRRVKDSNLITVSYDERGVPSEWSAQFVNDLLAQHMDDHALRSRQPEAQRFFEAQRTVLHARSRDAEAALLDFHRRHTFDSMPEQRTMWRGRVAELKARLADAEAEFIERHARVAVVESELAIYPRMIPVESRLAQNQALQTIKPRVLEKELELAKLRSTYAPTSLKVRDLERELDEARRLLGGEKQTLAEGVTAVNPTYQALELDLARARTELGSQAARVEAVTGELTNVTARVERLESVTAEQQLLEQEASTTREALLTYTRKAEEARLSSALDRSRIVNLAVARPAEPAPNPVGSHALLVMLGLAFSLTTAVVAAFGSDRFDSRVRGTADVETITNVPVLAEVM